jgi:hypothetical protein
VTTTSEDRDAGAVEEFRRLQTSAEILAARDRSRWRLERSEED